MRIVNPILQKLGFSPKDRVVIIHADDVGMCHSSLTAFEDLLDFGLVSSGSVMVPCPWFPDVANWCRKNRSADMGVHLTFNSEWISYRWPPISTCDPGTGLVDDEGYLHRFRAAVVQMADHDAIRVESSSQVERAINAGIDVTHIDSHQFTLINNRFTANYVRLGIDYRIPVLIFKHGTTEWLRNINNTLIQYWETCGLPVFDYVTVGGLIPPASERLAHTKELFQTMPAGLSCFLLHPVKNPAEVKPITPDWEYRIADYDVFRSRELKRHIENLGIQILNYRTLRNLMRGTTDVADAATPV